MSGMPSNNEAAKIASFGNKKKPKLFQNYSPDKLLDNSQFNAKEVVNDTSHDLGNENGYYTKKFERMLEKKDISKNSESLNHENSYTNADKNSSVCHNLVGNRITNVFTEKMPQNETINNQQSERNSDSEVLKFYYPNEEKSPAFTGQTNSLLNKMLHKINIVTDHESSEVANTVTGNSEHQIDLEEEYEVFKSEPSPATTTTTDTSRFLSNAQELESGDGPIIKKVKENKNNSFLKSMTTAQAKKDSDFEFLAKEFRADNNLSNAIHSALAGEFLHTGVTQKNIFNYLREKGIPGTVTQVKNGISAFFNDAAKAGIIKSRNRRFYLNTIGDTAIINNQQSPRHKLPEEKNDFEKSDGVITRNTPQKRKFVNENNNLEDQNNAETNILKRGNADHNVENSSLTAYKLGQSISNRETKNDEGEMESSKNTENEQSEAENSYLMKISMSAENEDQPVSENVMNGLLKQTVEAKRKGSKKVPYQDNKIKITILNMIKAARSRKKRIS